jgi:HEAT repeat protein
LLQAAKLPLDVDERIALAGATERASDPRLVPILATMLDPRVENLRWRAIASLMKIDTDEAAKILRPHLAEEGHLARKLEMAEFLGRHRIRDGYPYAIEHMSEPHLRDQAVAALAAIREPKALGELHQILKSSNDLEWNRAAIRALGRLGETAYAAQFLILARHLHHPECQASILALADLGDPAVLPILSEAFSSRNDEIVTTAARGTGTLLARANVKADDLRERLAALLADVDASQPARSAALESLVKLRDARLHHALAVAVRDGLIEGSGLLAQVERNVVERKVVLANH